MNLGYINIIPVSCSDINLAERLIIKFRKLREICSDTKKYNARDEEKVTVKILFICLIYFIFNRDNIFEL